MPLQNKIIAMDTNMLMAIIQFKTDVFGQIKELFGNNISFVVPKQVIRELDSMGEKSKARKREIALIKKIMNDNNIKVLDINAGHADSALQALAEQGAMIASNDKELRKKIKAFGKQIYLKKKRFIAIG